MSHAAGFGHTPRLPEIKEVSLSIATGTFRADSRISSNNDPGEPEQIDDTTTEAFQEIEHEYDAAEQDEDWGEYIDESTGIPYYFEHVSGRSSWEAPAAWKLLSNTVVAISRPSTSQTSRSRPSSHRHSRPSSREEMSQHPFMARSHLAATQENFKFAESTNDQQQRLPPLDWPDRKRGAIKEPPRVEKPSALKRFQRAAKKVTLAQRFYGAHAVRPIDQSKTAEFQGDNNNVVDREERNRYIKQLGLLHPAVIKHYDDQQKEVLARKAKIEDLKRKAASLKEEMNDASLAEEERQRQRSEPGPVFLQLMGEADEIRFSSIDEALEYAPSPPRKATISLGTGTYTFRDRPLIIEKDVVLTRKIGCWVKVVFESTTQTRTEVSKLLRMAPPRKGAQNIDGASPVLAAAVGSESDDANLRNVPCIQLRNQGAKLTKLQVYSNIQCGVVMTAACTAVSDCVLTGGGIVVRTERKATAADAAGVEVTDTQIHSTFDDGIVCEGPNTRCNLESNRIQGSDGYGIWVRFGACPTIRNNDVVSGHGDGVGVWHGRSAPIIVSNRITKNEGNGITITKAANPSIKDNTISHNNYAGIWVRERGRGKIELNRILSNGEGPLKAAVTDCCNVTTRKNQGLISARDRAGDVEPADDQQ